MSRPTISQVQMILPVFNEVKSLPIVLDEWSDIFKKNNITFQFIICEDGSTDGTKELLPGLKSQYPMILCQSRAKRGYGKAMLDGIKRASAPYLLCIDSDGQCDPNDFPNIWKKRNKNSIIIGERVIRKDSLSRQIFTHLFHIVFWFIFKDKLRDPSSCFLLAPKKILQNNLDLITHAAESFRWGVCASCLKRKNHILEIPINHRTRISGTTRVFTLSSIPGIVFRGVNGMVKIKFN